ncbi:MAG: hypothetical protein Q9163_002165 [Psora crenata]
MHFLRTNVILLAAGTAQLTRAHTTFSTLFVDNENQGDGIAIRMSNINEESNYPIPAANITGPDMACGVNGETGVPRIAAAKAGSQLTFEWREIPNKPGMKVIADAHLGPCAVYMKKVDNSAASNNAAGDGWFKILEETYDSTEQKWCTEKLMATPGGHLAATIPVDLAPGYYLVRPELLALHQAAEQPPFPQFYVGCAQIFLSSGGSATPSDTVSIPGYVSFETTPALTYNVWDENLKLPFPTFGPPVYKTNSTKCNLTQQAMTQEFGLKREECVMENHRWCAVMPPQYSDQDSCWASSNNCWNQSNTCFDTAPPTGYQVCTSWETYCRDIQDACPARNSNGLPSIENRLPTPWPELTGNVFPASTKRKRSHVRHHGRRHL